MNILLAVVLGALAGWIASAMMGSRNGVLTDVLLGIAGAVVGSFLFNIFGAAGTTGLNLYSLVVAVVGAVVLIWLRRLMIRA